MQQAINKLIAVILISLLWLPLSATEINFNSIKLTEATRLAEIQGKKVYVNFTAEWCLPCKIISESIYTDAEVIELINSNFIAISADVDSENGMEWNDLYNANYLPTIILAKKSGHEITRISRVPQKQELVSILRKVIEENPTKEKILTSTVRTTETKVTVSKSMFDIQLGAFANEKNAIKFFNEMKAKLPSDDFRILKKGTRNLYCVLLTGFNRISITSSKLEELKSIGIQGFIIEY